MQQRQESELLRLQSDTSLIRPRCLVFIVVALLNVIAMTFSQTDGATPLLVASRAGHAVVVEMLTEAFANVNQATMVSCPLSEHLPAFAGYPQLLRSSVAGRWPHPPR